MLVRVRKKFDAGAVEFAPHRLDEIGHGVLAQIARDEADAQALRGIAWVGVLANAVRQVRAKLFAEAPMHQREPIRVDSVVLGHRIQQAGHRRRIARFERHGTGKARAGLRVARATEQDPAQGAVRLRIRAAELDRLARSLLGFGRLAQLMQRGGQAGQRIDVVGPLLQHGAKALLSHIATVEVQRHHAEQKEREGMVGYRLQDVSIDALGLPVATRRALRLRQLECRVERDRRRCRRVRSGRCRFCGGGVAVHERCRTTGPGIECRPGMAIGVTPIVPPTRLRSRPWRPRSKPCSCRA